MSFHIAEVLGALVQAAVPDARWEGSPIHEHLLLRGFVEVIDPATGQPTDERPADARLRVTVEGWKLLRPEPRIEPRRPRVQPPHGGGLSSLMLGESRLRTSL